MKFDDKYRLRFCTDIFSTDPLISVMPTIEIYYPEFLRKWILIYYSEIEKLFSVPFKNCNPVFFMQFQTKRSSRKKYNQLQFEPLNKILDLLLPCLVSTLDGVCSVTSWNLCWLRRRAARQVCLGRTSPSVWPVALNSCRKNQERG